MKVKQLNAKWAQISASSVVKGHKSLRITSDCYSDVYLAIDERGNHCLILSLPSNHEFKFKAVRKEKVSLEYFADRSYLVMTLLDSEFNSLFDDLILSLFNAIKEIEDVTTYSKVFIQTFYQWVLFFSPEYFDKLSKDIIKGLYGELIVLKELILDSDSYDINDILAGWVGPYDQGHDFIYDDTNIEVKTKDRKKVSVRLSSEHQLEVEAGKGLILAVVSVDEDFINGRSLKMLLQELKQLTLERLGDLSIILKALLQKGLTLHNAGEYDNYRFRAITIHDYNCLEEGFPKITSVTIPSSISNVKYDLNLTDMSKYVVLVREL
ncbi:hypothetical protein NBRC116592_16930 [Colwellia sp. KU-HH00111]|uniref:PD-(D/E)XK motif protein n=1 Tax=Colwellia sp. KU-HH00111 TaxID=3127652 RepID=UPI003102A0FC